MRFRKIAQREPECRTFPTSRGSVGAGVSVLLIDRFCASAHSDIRHQQVRAALMTCLTSLHPY